MLTLVLFLLCLVPLISHRHDPSDLVRILTDCDEPCYRGACEYRDCEDTSPIYCPGGLCLFVNCNYPTCSGGACVFKESFGATCAGGSCSFIEPRDTLSHGYCTGDNCDLHGDPHPSFDGHLSL